MSFLPADNASSVGDGAIGVLVRNPTPEAVQSIASSVTLQGMSSGEVVPVQSSIQENVDPDGRTLIRLSPQSALSNEWYITTATLPAGIEAESLGAFRPVGTPRLVGGRFTKSSHPRIQSVRICVGDPVRVDVFFSEPIANIGNGFKGAIRIAQRGVMAGCEYPVQEAQALPVVTFLCAAVTPLMDSTVDVLPGLSSPSGAPLENERGERRFLVDFRKASASSLANSCLYVKP